LSNESRKEIFKIIEVKYKSHNDSERMNTLKKLNELQNTEWSMQNV